MVLLVTIITGQRPGEDVIHAFIHSTQIIILRSCVVPVPVNTVTNKTHLQRSPRVLQEAETIKHHVLPKI